MTDCHGVVDKGVQTDVDPLLDHIAQTVLINSDQLLRLMVARHQPDSPVSHGDMTIPDSQPDPPTY